GFAILVSLAVWQLQRLAWKEALIAEMSGRMAAAPVDLPGAPEEAAHGFLSVLVEGAFVGEPLHVLTSAKPGGPGFRVVRGFETLDGRRILVDRGYMPEAEKDAAWAEGRMVVQGTLLWPNETDSFTPEPNLARNIWFARDLDAMAEALGTEPLLISAQQPTGEPSPRPLRVGVNLSNNHLQYAITWSLLAVLWLAMTLYLVYRIRRNSI
ncbi:MAG: SURF1 family protein, partial [Pseudomonadota bacterium]